LRDLESFKNAHKHLANGVRIRRISPKKSVFKMPVGYIDLPIRRNVHKNSLIRVNNVPGPGVCPELAFLSLEL
jgi:hypothetical protein